MKNKITRIVMSAIGLTGIATATSIVLFNEPILKTQNQLNSNINERSIDTSDLIQLQQNQNQLLKEIVSKYDESKLLFSSWKNNNIDLVMKGILSKENYENYIDSLLIFFKNVNLFKNINSFNKEETFISKINFEENIKLSNSTSIVKNYENFNFSDLGTLYSFNQQIAGGTNYIHFDLKNLNLFSMNKNCYNNFVSISDEIPLAFNLPTNDKEKYEKQDDGTIYTTQNLYTKKLVIKHNVGKYIYENDSIHFEGPAQSIWYNSGLFLEPIVQENRFFYNNQELNIKNGNIPISFTGKNINWEKFFVLKPSNIDSDGDYYLGTTRPTIDFGLNVPLVNAINWFGKLPQKFNELKNLMNQIIITWSDYPFQFNEIFGSKENFYNFMNKYLINFANFYYDEATYNNLITLLNDLNKAYPTQEIINVIRALIKTNKDVEYKKIVIPANTINTSINDVKSGSGFNIDLISNYLNLDGIKFNTEIDNQCLWMPQEFTNINPINYWNSYSDIILPIILSQQIQVAWEDNYGNNYVSTVYDGKNFVPNAIKATAASNGFDTPYVSTKIKRIILGNLDTQPYLGTNIDINNLSEFVSFSNQSKLNATKTINSQEYVSPAGFNDPIYMEPTNNGIEIRFRFLSEEKQVEEGAWSDIQGNEAISPFMLIPDEAWGEGESFDTDPNSSLEDILNDMKSKTLYERALARPFIMKKNITTQDLEEAKKKYVDIFENDVKYFSKANIRNIFLTDSFTNKYNELSSKPWWTWTFAELVQEETNFNHGISGALNVVLDNSYQNQWFKNFVSNPNLANKTMNDFFPKYDEGRFFVIGSYKPSIDSTQIRLTEEAGFYYAGEQKDAYHQITNFNYVVELEVKNKTYTSKLDQLNIGNINYQGQLMSFGKYQKIMNSLIQEWDSYFALDNSRFKAGQIKPPVMEFVNTPSDNPFETVSYGYLKINYQQSMPVVNQIGNDVVYKQLPFDLNKIIGLDVFKANYFQYIINTRDEWNQLSVTEQGKHILIDNVNNEILIGGEVVAQLQNFKLQGYAILVIPDEYVDPKAFENNFFGFNQKSKEYISLDDLRKKWNSYSQDQLFNILFGNYNYNNQAQLLKETIAKYNATLYVRIDDDFRLFWGYTWPWDENGDGDLDDPKDFAYNETLDYVQLIKIEAVRTDLIQSNSFKYGYNCDKDITISFNSLINELRKTETLAQFFNLDEKQKQDFINGIRSIKIIKQDQATNTVQIQIELNDNYVLYSENDSLTITIKAIELTKFELDSLSLDNFSKEIKNQLSKKNNEEQIQYLNSLDLNTKLSLFTSSQSKYFVSNLSTSEDNNNSVQDIVFSYNEADLVADVKFNNPNLVLDSKTNKTLKNFDYNLKVALGLIDPHKQTKIIWLSVGIFLSVGIIAIILAWILIKRYKDKKRYYGSNKDNNNQDIDNNKILIQQKNIDSKNIN